MGKNRGFGVINAVFFFLIEYFYTINFLLIPIGNHLTAYTRTSYEVYEYMSLQ